MLLFGWRTALLSLVSVQVVVIAIALLRAARNRSANRSLAALLIVVVGLLTPFTIGFAGFYDAFPWLSFAPFSIPLAVGPLVYAYSHALVLGRPSRRLPIHLAPALAQFAYQLVCFTFPTPLKDSWDRLGHAPFVDPLVSVGAVVGLAIYSAASLRLLGRYRAGLEQIVGDEHRYAARWLSRAIGAVLIVLVVEIGFQGREFAFGKLSYFGVFGLYLVLAAWALYLAIEGWRHAELTFPRLEALSADPGPAFSREKDWRALGQRWAASTQSEGWWREPELTLPALALRLGINTHHLSRGLNEGLGVNFAGFVNGMRSTAVAQALNNGRREDLLDLAPEAGFNSKASFNRAFKAAYGVSPSEYRRRLGGSQSKFSSPGRVLRRAAS